MGRGIAHRVIKVAESIRRGETELTLISLEFYEDGFVANIGLHDEGPRPAASESILIRAPIYLAQAIDDQGNEHQGSPRGGRERDGHWRQSQHFIPGIAAYARLIHVTIGEILWKGLGQGVSSSMETGPWQFDIPLE